MSEGTQFLHGRPAVDCQNSRQDQGLSWDHSGELRPLPFGVRYWGHMGLTCFGHAWPRQGGPFTTPDKSRGTAGHHPVWLFIVTNNG